MKRLICTRADDRITAYTQYTLPIMKDAANKWGADFYILNNTKYDGDEGYFSHYRIMELYKLLEQYDVALNLDADLFIMKCCPNPFEAMQERMIHCIYEDIGTREEDRRSKIKAIQMRYGDVGWSTGAINDGFLLVYKEHREIFTPINGEYYEDPGQDDIHIGYTIHKLGFPIKEIGWRWNALGMFLENGQHSKTDGDINIIHAAGYGSDAHGIKRKAEYIHSLYKGFRNRELLFGQ